MSEKTIHSRAKRLGAIGSTVLLCTMATLIAPSGTWAADAVADPAASQAALQNVAAEDDSLLLSPLEASGIGVTEVTAGTITVPSTADESIILAGDDGARLDVAIPAEATSEASLATVQDDGTVTYPGEHFSSSVIVSDASVQMLTTIAGAEAPTSYRYDVTVKEGQTLELIDGGAAIVDADGTIAVAIGSAWAKDANGVDVPTHYEVDGNALTQIVDHTGSSVAYPVVADPIWLAPWVVRCLIGIGINGPTITRIASSGSPAAVLAAFGYGAFRCIIGR